MNAVVDARHVLLSKAGLVDMDEMMEDEEIGNYCQHNPM